MQYFKHMSNMRHDSKIKRLINKYGLEGYGLYCLITESITEKLSTESPIPELEDTCDDIAEFYNGNSAKIDEMVHFMISQGLFEIDLLSGRVTCLKIFKFLEASQTRSEAIRSMIKNYKDITALPPPMSETVTDNHDRKEEKRKEQEEKKPSQKKMYGILNNVPLSDNEYSSMVERHGQDVIERYIEAVSVYIPNAKKKYTDFSAVIYSWIRKDKEEGKFKESKKTIDVTPKPEENCPRCGYPRLGMDVCDQCVGDDWWSHSEQKYISRN